ncbi:MAG TPA: glycosyltransferase [Gammaproteobacteria bacterium]|nr:glycosyltransferase [Gammaproteobacteria bacterium]
MKVLFLTSKLGYGHTRAADAIEYALMEKVPNVETHHIDLWSLMDERVANSVKDGYLRMARQYRDYYQKLYNLDVGLWRQLSGEEPADTAIREFLSTQQQKWFPDESHWLGVRRQNLDRALINSLISLICSSHERGVSRKIILRSILILMRTVLVNRLQERISQFMPDIIVATQMYPAGLLAQVKKKNNFRNIPTLGIITDFGLHGSWVHASPDIYCAGCGELFAQLTGRGISQQRIHLTGIPLMPQFRRPPDMQTARRKLGIDPDRKTIAVTGGQYGIGIVEAVYDLVKANADFQMLVTTGQSPAETTGLKHLAAGHASQIHVFDWVEDMSAILGAADVVVGKPGGLSVSESLACGRPFFATCSLGGQEKHNIDFLTCQGVGGEVRPQNLAQTLKTLLNSESQLSAMKRYAYALGQRNGAEKIAALAEKIWIDRKDGATSGASL